MSFIIADEKYKITQMLLEMSGARVCKCFLRLCESKKGEREKKSETK